MVLRKSHSQFESRAVRSVNPTDPLPSKSSGQLLHGCPQADSNWVRSTNPTTPSPFRSYGLGSASPLAVMLATKDTRKPSQAEPEVSAEGEVLGIEASEAIGHDFQANGSSDLRFLWWLGVGWVQFQDGAACGPLYGAIPTEVFDGQIARNIFPRENKSSVVVGELNLKLDQCPEVVVGFAVWSNRRGAKELCGLAIGFQVEEEPFDGIAALRQRGRHDKGGQEHATSLIQLGVQGNSALQIRRFVRKKQILKESGVHVAKIVESVHGTSPSPLGRRRRRAR